MAVLGPGVTGKRKSVGVSEDGASDHSAVRAVDRSLSILLAFTRDRPEQTLDELSEATQLAKSTTHRLLATLMANGFVERGNTPSNYRLGLSVAIIGSVAIRARRPREQVHRVLEKVQAETNETAGLSVRQGKSIAIVDRVESQHALRYNLGIGAMIPAHATSSGKVLLGGLAVTELEALAPDGMLPAFTHHTITKLADLLLEVSAVRDRGYALDNEELAEGLRCVAVPVYDSEQRVVFALGISGPSTRLSLDRSVRLVPGLSSAAAEISSLLDLEDS